MKTCVFADLGASSIGMGRMERMRQMKNERKARADDPQLEIVKITRKQDPFDKNGPLAEERAEGTEKRQRGSYPAPSPMYPAAYQYFYPNLRSAPYEDEGSYPGEFQVPQFLPAEEEGEIEFPYEKRKQEPTAEQEIKRSPRDTLVRKKCFKIVQKRSNIT